ncbi:hypothetical protein ACFE04_030563 [Oxalis oulophora]
MRRYSPGPRHYSPPRRGYGGRGRSPPRRGGYGGGPSGGYGGRKDRNHGSLLVRNIPRNCRTEELRAPFERFGNVRDVYIPNDYYTGEPRGFAFVQFVDPYEAAEAQHHMDGMVFDGREISVVIASENRKRPEEMRHRTRVSRPYEGRQPYYGSHSRSRSPHPPPSSRRRYRSRSYSPAPRRREDYSISPRRHADSPPRSPRGPPPPRDGDHNRGSFSPGYGGAAAVQDQNGNGYGK